MVHFGRLPDELRRRHDAVLQVDVAFNSATVPGRKVAEVFDAGVRAYERTGFPDEWRKHHQGGPTGYQGRSYKGAPGVAGEVLPSQAYAWNPSITGTKSEDTILATEQGIEFLSVPAGWPVVEVSSDGARFAREDILVR
jgi:Xaa-Pro aminopeptidase